MPVFPIVQCIDMLANAVATTSPLSSRVLTQRQERSVEQGGKSLSESRRRTYPKRLRRACSRQPRRRRRDRAASSTSIFRTGCATYHRKGGRSYAARSSGATDLPDPSSSSSRSVSSSVMVMITKVLPVVREDVQRPRRNGEPARHRRGSCSRSATASLVSDIFSRDLFADGRCSSRSYSASSRYGVPTSGRYALDTHAACKHARARVR